MAGSPAAVPPARKLAALVAELRRWAEANPGLRPLWTEFHEVARQLETRAESGERLAVPAPVPASVSQDRARRCPTCRAMPGHPCISRSGTTLWHYVHAARRQAA